MAKNIGKTNSVPSQARKAAKPGPKAKRAKAKFKPPRLKNYG